MLPDLYEIRRMYSQASKNSRLANQLYQILSELSTADPLLTAYKAAALALKAKNAWDVFSKMFYINEASQLFAQAVKAADENIEIRFLRFSVQSNIPAFLGLSGQLEEDKNMMLKHIATAELPVELKQAIAKFLSASDKCSQEEIVQLRPFL